MVYYQYQVTTAPELREVLMAFFSRLPFESFEETDSGFRAFLPQTASCSEVEARLEELKASYSFEYIVEEIAPRNWNALWESGFQPLLVGNFCGVRADFHQPLEEVEHELIINPKMAFGTGHHATTFMMIQMMAGLSFEGTRVLDYGCGTGILAILAARLGATRVDGIDIEEAAYENAVENAGLNGVAARTHFLHGTLQGLIGKVYDIILANINRNVILDSLPALYPMLSTRGLLLLSGILSTDKQIILDTARKNGFTFVEGLERGDWVCLKFAVNT